MRRFFLRLFAILIVILAQAAFVGLLLPDLRAPVFILVSVVAWSFILPFPEAHLVTVPLAVLFDAYAFGALSPVTFYTVWLAYVTGFTARRLMDNRGINVFLYALFAMGAVLLYEILAVLLATDRQTFFITARSLFSWSGVKPLLQSFLGAGIFFFVAYFFIRRFENYLRYLKEREFSGMR